MALIVHVDDQEELTEGISYFLHLLGHKVISFNSLAEARLYQSGLVFSNEVPDLYVLDGNIDGVGDGLRFARQLLDQGYNVVIMSSEEPPADFVWIKKLQLTDAKVSQILDNL